jgi:hypothetical protein
MKSRDSSSRTASMDGSRDPGLSAGATPRRRSPGRRRPRRLRLVQAPHPRPRYASLAAKEHHASVIAFALERSRACAPPAPAGSRYRRRAMRRTSARPGGDAATAEHTLRYAAVRHHTSALYASASQSWATEAGTSASTRRPTFYVYSPRTLSELVRQCPTHPKADIARLFAPPYTSSAPATYSTGHGTAESLWYR